MPFSHILGNEAAKQTLTGLLAQKKLPHALLFAGPDGVGKSVFALETAKALLGEKDHARCANGSHPDLHVLRPEGKAELHTIETIRTLIEEAAFPPFEAPCKVFIFYEADRMLPTSSNALLKTLEEPQTNTYFLLLTSHAGAILPTIASRTRKIPFFPIPDPAIQQHAQTVWSKDPAEAERISLLAGGSFAKAEALAQQQTSQWREQLHAALQTGESSKLLATLEENTPDTDLLLESIFAYHRDRHRAAAKEKMARPSPALEEILERLLIARTALERHTSLRATLEYLINN
jgi:DNA polymerase-3 subunit delta'